MSNREQILESLKILFERAEREGLWFHCSYQDLWFSPSELRDQHNGGMFIWSARNWMLRNPQERVNELEKEEAIIQAEKKEFLCRIKPPKKS